MIGDIKITPEVYANLTHKDRKNEKTLFTTVEM